MNRDHLISRTVFAVATLAALTVLGIANVIDSEAATSIILLLVGYVLGNGVLLGKQRKDGP